MSHTFKKVADFAQKGAALSLAGLFVYHIGQIAYQVQRGYTPNQTVDTQYFEKVKEKVEEEKSKAGLTGYRDWYSKEDDSYLKDLPRADVKGTSQTSS